MIDQDEARVIYDDTRYFSRGRSGFRPDPKVRERIDAWWALVAVGVLVVLFVVVRLLLPVIR